MAFPMWPAAVSAYALVVHARIAIKNHGRCTAASGRSVAVAAAGRGMAAMPLNSAAIDQMSALPGSPVRKYISGGPPTRRDSLNNVRLGLRLPDISWKKLEHAIPARKLRYL